MSAIKSFVDSKIKETVKYINARIQNKIKTEPSTDYVLINNIDVFNSWEQKLAVEELLAYTVGCRFIVHPYATARVHYSRPFGVYE